MLMMKLKLGVFKNNSKLKNHTLGVTLNQFLFYGTNYVFDNKLTD